MKVLVYGTLRQGQVNHRILVAGNAKYVADVKLAGFHLFNTGYGYPAAVKADLFNLNRMVCELYEIDENTLANLDRLEGYPTHYNRIEVECGPNGETAWIYVYDIRKVAAAKMQPIGCNDWVKFKSEFSNFVKRVLES